jgi:NAD-dependent dihydropyrimidine dehydrogenase PreA subunit
MRPVIDKSKCTACGSCKEDCPADPNVFEVTDTAEVVNPDACIECGTCEASCPTGAIELKD